MSYILEALRRAETERERKRGVPGLHTQPVPVQPSEELHAPRSRGWLWLALGLAAGLLVALLWHWWSGDAADDDALARGAATGSVTSSMRAPAEALPPPPSTAAPLATATATANQTATPPPTEPPPTHATAAPTEPAPQQHATTAKVRAKATPLGMPAPAAEPTAVKRTETHAASPAAAPPVPSTAAASAPEARLRTLAELPSDLQRAVPALSFGGSVYSEVPAQRMVILNGQVLREGDTIGDDVQIEQIRARSAVLRVRGQRFEMPF